MTAPISLHTLTGGKHIKHSGFSWALNLLYNTDKKQHRSIFLSVFGYNAPRQARPPEAERSNHVSVMV